MAYSTLIAQNLHHQEQESWSTTILNREQHIILMDNLNGTLADPRYPTYDSNVTRQEQKSIELQTHLTSTLTFLTCPKTPQQIHQQFKDHN